MLTFLTTLYNEEDEIQSLIDSVVPYVDAIRIVDDGSTDRTQGILLENWWRLDAENLMPDFFTYHIIEHTGLCELARIEALSYVEDGSWVLMLDADERMPQAILAGLRPYLEALPENVTHLWFSQDEFIDGTLQKTFAKVKVYRKESVTLPKIIHGDPQFTGDSIDPKWNVIHRKTSTKQIIREAEYVETYDKLLKEGKIDEGQRNWFLAMHYYVKELVPHG